MVADGLKIAESFIDYFTNFTQDPEIDENDAHLSRKIGIENTVDKAVGKYKNILELRESRSLMQSLHLLLKISEKLKAGDISSLSNSTIVL